MDIYIVIVKTKDGGVYSVASFTNSRMAYKFAKTMKKIPDSSEAVYGVIKSTLFDTM